MALNWDITEIKNVPFKDESLTEDEKDAEWRVFEHIVFSCMGVGIGWIKDEAEAKEWFNRYRVYSVHSGYDDYLTLDQVKSYIGLLTNVPRESRTKWDMRMRKQYNLR